MKDLIKEVALDIANKLDPARAELGGDFQFGFNTVQLFAELVVAELSKRAEAVGEMHESHTKPPKDADGHWCKEILLYSPNNPGDLPKYRVPVFTFPPTHDIEAIENRVAEACAKLADAQQEMRIKFIEGMGGESRPFVPKDTAEAIRNQEWRKHK
jgi:hypothetical protein